MLRIISLWLTSLVLAACAMQNPPRAAIAVEARAPVTILVSIDGFRADYLDRGVTPALSKLAAGGVSAAMRPSFPSKTFPNHHAIVTGLRPDRNGIVANRMEDPRRPGETFTLANPDPFWWSESTPLWIDAERAGIRSAMLFWPGANVAIGGTRPADWQQFNQAVTNAQRVAAVLDWLRRPAATRPKFVTLYFDTVDTAGHEFGPDDPRTTGAVADVDRHIGVLVAGLADLGQPANIVVVADHGMASMSSERTIALDTLASRSDYRVIESGPYAGLAAMPGREAALEARLLGKHAHVRCWRKAEFPARLHYGRNPRVPPYLCLAEPGWLIVETAPAERSTGGAHGYDPAAPEMAALFVANGPAFVAGRRLTPFDNVDVYPLLRTVIGLPPATGIDGGVAPSRGALRR